MDTLPQTADPALDLMLERDLDVPPGVVWACWTRADLLRQWFCPLPWTVSEVEIDPRPGGVFRTVMRSPEGIDHAHDAGCFLEIVPERRLVWTDALQPGFRPGKNPFMTGIITMDPLGAGTRYRALVLHADAQVRGKHDAMGFHEGWGKATDQLLALARTL